MGFPSSPINGQRVVVNNITYVYNNTKTAWSRLSTPGVPLSANSLVLTSPNVSISTTSGALIVTGGAGIGGNLHADRYYTHNGLYWANNNESILGGLTYSNVEVAAYLNSQKITSANIGGSQIFANANAAAQQIQINTIVSSANTNTAAYLQSYTGNIQAGNVTVTGNVNVTSNVFANVLYTTNGIRWAGNGAVFSSGGGGGGGGGTFTASNTAPGGASAGDQWYYIAGDILFEYIDDGDSSQWVDTSTPAVATATTVSDLTLSNVTISSVYNISATRTALGITPTVSPTPPVSPVRGDLWYDTSTDILYQYTYDGTTNYWVDISSAEFGYTTNTSTLATTVVSGNITPISNVTYTLGTAANAFGNIYTNAVHTYKGIYWAGNGNVVATGGGTVSAAASVGYSLVFGG